MLLTLTIAPLRPRSIAHCANALAQFSGPATLTAKKRAASAASASHHAWSASPWTRRFHLSLRGGAPYHPDAAGMAAVAELVLGTLAGPPGRFS